MQANLDTIRSEILDAIANDQLVLPTMPEVALRLREEVKRKLDGSLDRQGYRQ